MLVAANREIKSLNYKLLRIVSANDYHNNLFPYRNNKVEIIENTQIYCKIHVKNYLMPVKVSFQVTAGEGEAMVALKRQKTVQFKEGGVATK